MDKLLLIIVMVTIYLLIINTYYNIDSKIEKFIINKSNKDTKNIIPNIIWTYWDADKIPNIVKKCINSWKKLNPNYEIIILNDQKIMKMFNFDLKNIKNKNAFRKADFARIIAVQKHGGIWIDSSILLLKPLDDILPKYQQLDFIGFIAPQTTNFEKPIIENWFFAAPKNSKLLKDWLNESLYMNTFQSENHYIQSINKEIDLQNLYDSLPYLIMHATLAKCIQTNKYNYKLLKATSENGPFQYLHDNNWESEKSIKSICNGTNQYMVKLRGIDRKILENNITNCKLFEHF